MRENDNAIFMEPEEYQVYLAQEEPIKVLQVNKAEDNEIPVKDNDNSEVELAQLTLYELNQQLIANLPIYDEEKWQEAEKILVAWLNEHQDDYYMLLCKELSYYTLFDVSREDLEITDFIKELFDILVDLGTVKDISIDTNDMIAIWLNWHGEETPRCFYLFPYGAGVVHV